MKAALSAKLNEEVVPEAEVIKVQEVRTESNDNSEQETNDDKEDTPDVSSTKGKEVQHSVSYNRFKEVNEAKKSYKQRALELERELESYKSSAKVEPSAPSQNYFQEFDEYYKTANDEGDKYTSLEKRLQVYEQRVAEVELEAELGSITKQYPDVPEQLLLQAVIKTPNVNLLEVAKEYSQFIAEIEERAIAKHVKKAPEAPRRPSSVGSSVATKPTVRTMADAKRAALEYMTKNGL